MYIHKPMAMLLLAVTCGLAACSSQPSYKAKDTEQLLKQHDQWQYTQQNAQQVTYLTDLISIDKLEPIIAQALANNPSYNQVRVALKLAYAQRQVTAASQWFSVNADVNAQRSEDEGTQYSSSLGVSWEADVWQKNADSVSAQDMTIASSQADYQGARDTLVATVMRTYLNIILRQNLLHIEQQRLVVLENNEQSIIERYQFGLGDLEVLDTARTSTASTRATIADYVEQIAQSTRALEVLAGVDALGNLSVSSDSPVSSPALSVETSMPDVLQPLAQLPVQDLSRRPDLQSAFYQIEAQRYLVDVSYKALLPSITLSATLSDLANTPSQALLKSPLWTLLGDISAPLFQGGALRAQVDIAKLNAEQAFWDYQDTLLTAVNEVENALGQEQSLNTQQAQIKIALQSAQRSFTNYQSKYQQGLVDILDLLTVQQTVYDLQAQLAQLNYTLQTNRIDLGLALGLGVSS